MKYISSKYVLTGNSQLMKELRDTLALIRVLVEVVSLIIPALTKCSVWWEYR